MKIKQKIDNYFSDISEDDIKQHKKEVYRVLHQRSYIVKRESKLIVELLNKNI